MSTVNDRDFYWHERLEIFVRGLVPPPVLALLVLFVVLLLLQFLS